MTLPSRGFAFKGGTAQHLVIVHVFERVADHADAHVDEVRGSHLKNLLRELLPVFVDLLREEEVGSESVHVRGVTRTDSCERHTERANLDGQVGDDGPLVSL